MTIFVICGAPAQLPARCVVDHRKCTCAYQNRYILLLKCRGRSGFRVGVLSYGMDK